MLNHYWIRVAVMLVLAIALPVQASAAAMMSVGGTSNSQSGTSHSGTTHVEQVVVKRDCHGQIVQTKILVPAQTSTENGDDDSGSTCPHCSAGCTMAGLTFSVSVTRENASSLLVFAPRPISFLSYIGRVPEHPPKA
jgi:hypothetical protein